MNPAAINFSRVASERPSMFNASRLTSREKLLIFFAWQSGFVQYKDFTSFIWRIWVSPPQTGQIFGITIVPLRVKFSAICGMIMFALYTVMVSPTPSSIASMMLMLWTLARLTVVPSSSTGSKIATGLIRPVRDALHSISRSVVSRISSAHLKAMELRGNFAVRPSASP